MTEYRAKPVKAFQYQGQEYNKMPSWVMSAVFKGARFIPCGDTIKPWLKVSTPEGMIYRADLGYYVFQDDRGEIHVCSQEVFEAIYEPTKETDDTITIDVAIRNMDEVKKAKEEVKELIDMLEHAEKLMGKLNRGIYRDYLNTLFSK